MFDNIKLKSNYKPPPIFFNCENTGVVLYLNVVYSPIWDRKKGVVKYYVGDLDNLRISIYRSCATISNSIHKYYKGNNIGDFTLNEIQDCVSTISMLTGFDWHQAVPSFLEYGPNIQNVDSLKIINSIESYKDKQYFYLTKNGTVYGKECEFERYYTLKAYDKQFEAWKTAGIKTGGNIFRWEVAAEFRHIERLFGNCVPTFGEIINPKNCYLEIIKKDCLEKFNNSTRLSNGFDLTKLTLGEKQMVSYMLNQSIKEDIRLNHPEKYKKDRARFLKLIKMKEHQIDENINYLIEKKINDLIKPVPACSIVDNMGKILPYSDKEEEEHIINLRELLKTIRDQKLIKSKAA